MLVNGECFAFMQKFEDAWIYRNICDMKKYTISHKNLYVFANFQYFKKNKNFEFYVLINYLYYLFVILFSI